MFLDRDIIPPRRKKANWKSLILGILLGFGAGFGLSKAIHTYWIFPFVVKNGEMSPAFPPGSTVYINRRNNVHQLKRGDIVLVRHPLNDHYMMLRRVIALSGETMEIKDRRILINGSILSADERKKLEPGALPVRLAPGEFSNRDNIQPVTIPENHLFILSDNRLSGIDSRDLGPVAMDQIVGKAEY